MFHLISCNDVKTNNYYDQLLDGFSPFFNRPGVDIHPDHPLHLVYIHEDMGAIGAARLFSTTEMSLEKKQIIDVGFREDDRVWECNRIVFFDRFVKRYIKKPEDFFALKKKFYDELYEVFQKIARERNISVILSVHSRPEHDDLVSIAKWPFILETSFRYPNSKGSCDDVLGVLPIF